jgi:hypothetical protein
MPPFFGLFTNDGQYELVHLGFQVPLLGDVVPVVRILLEGASTSGATWAASRVPACFSTQNNVKVLISNPACTLYFRMAGLWRCS